MRISRLKIKANKSSDFEKTDEKKRLKLRMRLTRNSEKERRSQLKAENAPALKRGAAHPTELTEEQRKELGLNKSGNLRGMHVDSAQMKKIRSLRKFYGPRMPTLQCNACSISSICPQYRAGYECAFLPFLSSHKIDDENDITGYMKDTVAANIRRLHQSIIFEQVSGSAPNLELSEQLNLAFMQLDKLNERMKEENSLDVDIETDDQSIIGQIFGGLKKVSESTNNALHDTADEALALESTHDENSEDILLTTQHDLIKDFERQNNTSTVEDV